MAVEFQQCVPYKYDSTDPLIHLSSGNKGPLCNICTCNETDVENKKGDGLVSGFSTAGLKYLETQHRSEKIKMFYYATKKQNSRDILNWLTAI